MKTFLVPSLKITFLTLILFGGIYPIAVSLIANVMAPNKGEGAVIEINGKVVGFEAIGQSFHSARYFNSRPSAVGYNAAATGGSNKGTTNPDYLMQVEERIADFLKQNPDVEKSAITVDLVTASGSGLDPHISRQAAEIQISRIARERGLTPIQLQELIQQQVEKENHTPFESEKVNVLKLNIALDNLQ
jgi:K+-transporting ATPase ATPase C chain